MSKTVKHDQVVDRIVDIEGPIERIQFDNELKVDILAQQLRELRLKKNLSLTQLANKIGMEKGQLSKIENGKSNLTLATINRIATALDVKLNFDLQPI